MEWSKILFILVCGIIAGVIYSNIQSTMIQKEVKKVIKIEKMNLVRKMVLWEYDCRTQSNGVGTFAYNEEATYFYCKSSETDNLAKFCEVNTGGLVEDFKTKQIVSCDKKINN